MSSDTDWKQTAAKVAEELLSHMTLTQKLNQLSGTFIQSLDHVRGNRNGSGALSIMTSCAVPEEMRRSCSQLTEQFSCHSRRKIAPLIHCEALSGPMMRGYALFPAPLGIGASFDPVLNEQTADVIRMELYETGIRQCLAPVLDLARDFRWGRTGETYGCDPTLTAAMGCSFIRGLHGKDPRKSVLATAKHFIGYSIPEGGLNSSRLLTDERDIHENFAKPFAAAAALEDLGCVMSAYGEINGIPLCANQTLLTKLLREELKFQGFVVSDYLAIHIMAETLGLENDPAEAGKQCLLAGLDMELPDACAFSSRLREMIKTGLVSESALDLALKRILIQKYRLGLLEESSTNTDTAFCVLDPRHKADADSLSQKAAEESLTLVQNNGILPLKEHASVLLAGPCADSLRLYNNSYTWAAALDVILGNDSVVPDTMKDVFSVFSGNAKADSLVEHRTEQFLREEHPGARTLREALENSSLQLEYVPGCGLTKLPDHVQKAVAKAAARSDVVILAVGGKVGWDESCTGGEGIDNVTADLPLAQQILIQTVFDVNPNIVLVHSDGKPLICPSVYDKASAVLEAWLPGPFGGNAIADVLLGKICPGGRLPVDVPYHSGQMPLYYYQHKAPLHRGYLNVPAAPRYPFGFGLSYTNFQYENPQWTLSPAPAQAADTSDEIPVLTVSVVIQNIGKITGDEVVQLYGTDDAASVSRPRRQLLGFRRIRLKPGEKKNVTFFLSLDALSFWKSGCDWILEAGSFTFFLARDSADASLPYSCRLEHSFAVSPEKRCFYAHSIDSNII